MHLHKPAKKWVVKEDVKDVTTEVNSVMTPQAMRAIDESVAEEG